MKTLYRNARVFTADDATPWADAFVVDGAEFSYVGGAAGAEAQAGPNAEIVDLDGRLVLPGFIDAHAHMQILGEALGKVGLRDARTLTEMQEILKAAHDADPAMPRLFGRGWLFDSLPGTPTADMIDEVLPQVPVYLEANDGHSWWVNRAALDELGIDRDTPDPIGGRIARDAAGDASGMLYETAVTQLVWNKVSSFVTDDDRDTAVERAVDGYLAAGVTGAVDMAFDELELAALLRVAARRGGALPFRVVAHWFVQNTGDETANLAQVQRAVQLAAEHADGWLRIAGIKLVLDGVIDACTAAMNRPYANGSNEDPIWTLDEMTPVVVAADAAGLQVAIHAIGDRASDQAIDALERAAQRNGTTGRRHRIEHLEYASPETPRRLAELGITESMQPVHADPAIYDNWVAMLGDERPERSFAWPEYVEAGALLAFSTDAPTAPHEALHNMYVAATRRSAIDASYPPNNPHLSRPLAESIAHATRDAAGSIREEDRRGRIVAGLLADFAVVDTDPFLEGEASLLTAAVVRTVLGGRTVYAA
jgi:predicted amidohydrolase YtcJ